MLFWLPPRCPQLLKCSFMLCSICSDCRLLRHDVIPRSPFPYTWCGNHAAKSWIWDYWFPQGRKLEKKTKLISLSVAQQVVTTIKLHNLYFLCKRSGEIAAGGNSPTLWIRHSSDWVKFACYHMKTTSSKTKAHLLSYCVLKMHWHPSAVSKFTLQQNIT